MLPTTRWQKYCVSKFVITTQTANVRSEYTFSYFPGATNVFLGELHALRFCGVDGRSPRAEILRVQLGDILSCRRATEGEPYLHENTRSHYSAPIRSKLALRKPRETTIKSKLRYAKLNFPYN